MNTKLLLQTSPELEPGYSLSLCQGEYPPTLAKLDKQAGVGNPFFPIPHTRQVIRKIRGTREGKCVSAFHTVIEGIKCR